MNAFVDGLAQFFVPTHLLAVVAVGLLAGQGAARFPVAMLGACAFGLSVGSVMIAAALLGGLRVGLVMIVGAYLIVRAARWYFYRRLGGVNGDCLGAVEQLLEIFVLLLFTCRNCSW